MIRGQYTAGTGMMVQRRKMEVITNNIVNAETTGYKKEMLVTQSFEDVMLERINDPAVLGARRMVGPFDFGVQSDQIYLDFETGNLEQTEIASNLAIAGNAFFVMQTPQGERYTRSGAFDVNREGYLVNPDGNFVLGNNGPLQVGFNGFSVDEIGNVVIDNTQIDSLRMVTFDNLGDLRKQGDNLYYSVGAQGVAAQNYVVKQGFVENSNVDIGREMVDMITVYRAYETNQRILNMTDETVGKAVNEIGGLR